MAKVIKYKFLSCEINRGTKEKPDIQQVFLEKTMTWSEINEKIAKEEACNGEYVIEDDGRPAPEPVADEVLNALLGVTV